MHAYYVALKPSVAAGEQFSTLSLSNILGKKRDNWIGLGIMSLVYVLLVILWKGMH